MVFPAELSMTDIVKPKEEVEIQVAEDNIPGTIKLWINVDGICRLRIGQIPVNMFKTYIPNPTQLLKIYEKGN